MRADRVLLTLAGCVALIGCPEDDDCRSQCELAAAACDEQPLASFGDLETGRVTYQERCEEGALWAFQAECEEGTLVLRSGTGYTSEGRFYDPDSGAFLGLTTTTDAQSPPCHGKSYWPNPVPCTAPVVTRVLCGTAFDEGAPAGRGVTQ